MRDWWRAIFAYRDDPELFPGIKPFWLMFVCLAVSLVPLLLNLDITGFIEDEGIRNLVALEMRYSGNYIAPTLYGEAYLNKPPLWNWILLAAHEIGGGPTIFNARLASIFFLLVFCVTIFFGFRKPFGDKIALLNALILLTCGRILFWDSMLSLIDICFSWIVFCMFLWVYKYGSRGKYLMMFTGAYSIATIAFFLKALPALVFLGFTLLAAMLWWRKWKKLFSLEHLAGFAILAAVAGAYFWAYSQYFPVEDLLMQYLSESTKRTVAEHTFLESIQHVFVFPVESLYHFAPWSLLVLVFINKRSYETIKGHPFAAFLLLVFAANIWVYWTSPNVYPRYLFMFLPLLTGPAVYLMLRPDFRTNRVLIEGIFLFLAIAFLFGFFVPIWVEDTQMIDGLVWKCVLAFVLGAACVFLLLKYPSRRLIVFFFMLLVVRLWFDLVVLPPRGSGNWEAGIRSNGNRVGENYKDEDMYILRFWHLHYSNGFYITRAREEILTQRDTLVPGAIMIIEDTRYDQFDQQPAILDSLHLFERNRFAIVARVKGSD